MDQMTEKVSKPLGEFVDSWSWKLPEAAVSASLLQIWIWSILKSVLEQLMPLKDTTGNVKSKSSIGLEHAFFIKINR